MGRSSKETMGHFPSEERCLLSRYHLLAATAGCNSPPSLQPSPTHRADALAGVGQGVEHGFGGGGAIEQLLRVQMPPAEHIPAPVNRGVCSRGEGTQDYMSG